MSNPHKRFLSERAKKQEKAFLDAARNYMGAMSRFEFDWLYRKPYDNRPGNEQFYLQAYAVMNLVRAMDIRHGGRILEVGSGPGWVGERASDAPRLRRRRYRAVGRLRRRRSRAHRTGCRDSGCATDSNNWPGPATDFFTVEVATVLPLSPVGVPGPFAPSRATYVRRRSARNRRGLARSRRLPGRRPRSDVRYARCRAA